MATNHPPTKPRGLLRWVYRLPIGLYRARLGWLLGHRFLLLTHRGRRTSKLRHVVLEVVRYDPATRESAVLSAYGERADWYRNILAHPPVEVRTGRTRYAPRWRPLGPDERLAALRTYRRRYRRAFRAVMRLLGYPYDGSEAGLSQLADQVVMVAFRPREAREEAQADSPDESAASVHGPGHTGAGVANERPSARPSDPLSAMPSPPGEGR